jgi:hypothetical protein
MPVSQTVMPAQKTGRLASRRTLEKVDRSAVQFGEKIFENARRDRESGIGRRRQSQASINRRVPSDCPTRALGEPPWR